MTDTRSHRRLPRQAGRPGSRGRTAKLLDLEGFRRLLRLEVDRAGGQSAWSRKTGVDRPHLSRVLNAHAEPGPTLINALGLEKVIAYRHRK